MFWSEIGSGCGGQAGRHTPTTNSEEYPPPPHLRDIIQNFGGILSSSTFRLLGLPPFLSLILSCPCITITIAGVDFPLNAHSFMGNVAQVTKPRKVNGRVVLFSVNLEVILQEFLGESLQL